MNRLILVAAAVVLLLAGCKMLPLHRLECSGVRFEGGGMKREHAAGAFGKYAHALGVDDLCATLDGVTVETHYHYSSPDIRADCRGCAACVVPIAERRYLISVNLDRIGAKQANYHELYHVAKYELDQARGMLWSEGAHHREFVKHGLFDPDTAPSCEGF